MVYIYTYMCVYIYAHTVEYYLAIKKWNHVICSNMIGPKDYHTKWSKSDRERQIPYDFTYMWNLKFNTNEHICETETDSQTEQTCGCQGGGGGGKGVWD